MTGVECSSRAHRCGIPHPVAVNPMRKSAVEFVFSERSMMGKGGSRYGAGRPGWHIKAEECLKVNVRDWLRVGGFERDDCGTMYLGKGSAVRYRVDGDASTLTLEHVLTGRAMEQRVPLTSTPCHYGGARPWLACPQCSRRVAILFLGTEGFGCRQCSNVAYASQSEDKMDRAWRKQRKIERRLGAHHTQPEGMQFRTYLRLKGLIAQCETRRLEVLAAFVDRVRTTTRKDSAT